MTMLFKFGCSKIIRQVIYKVRKFIVLNLCLNVDPKYNNNRPHFSVFGT